MENTLFYTFSTIAQTLVAAIALLGAFALYRLQSISASLHDLAVSVIQPYLPNEAAQKLLGEERFAELAEYLRNTPPARPQEASAPYYVGKRSAFADHLAKQISIQRLLKWVLSTTVVVISGAVAVLSMTTMIVPCAIPVLAAGVGAFIGCLVLYAVFVMKALR